MLRAHGVHVAPHLLAEDAAGAVGAARELGYPVVMKLCGDTIAHKTERGLVRLSLSSPDEVHRAAGELLAAARPQDGSVQLLVAPMVAGNRELIGGLHSDEQFGMTIMLGIGGVMAEAIADVAVRLVPIERVDSWDMLDQLASQTLFAAFRGEPPIDRDAVVDLLLSLSDAAIDNVDLVSAELNPIVINDGRPVAVDAMVEIAE